MASSLSSAAAEHTSVTPVIASATTVLCHEEPYHPPKTLTFPKTIHSKTSRHCHAEWFRTWRWLHYVQESDSVYCYLCLFADSRGLLNKTCKRDSTFVTTVFTNWKHACEKFTCHEKNENHKMCAKKVVHFTSKVSVTALLSKQSAQEQAAARKCMWVIFFNHPCSLQTWDSSSRAWSRRRRIPWCRARQSRRCSGIEDMATEAWQVDVWHHSEWSRRVVCARDPEADNRWHGIFWILWYRSWWFYWYQWQWTVCTLCAVVT